jgi:hypothetical protein
MRATLVIIPNNVCVRGEKRDKRRAILKNPHPHTKHHCISKPISIIEIYIYVYSPLSSRHMIKEPHIELCLWVVVCLYCRK